jgi:hypothetical protein
MGVAINNPILFGNQTKYSQNYVVVATLTVDPSSINSQTILNMSRQQTVPARSVSKLQVSNMYHPPIRL